MLHNNPSIELALLLTEAVRRKAQRKIDQYYPETGPLRRELYTKHMEFFRAGANFRQRLMLAANRIGKCITICSKVETTDGPKTVQELLGAPFEVWAWDGTRPVKAQATAPFRKEGLHHTYRLTMEDGQWIECADEHRVLCHDGYRRLSELLPLFEQDHRVSTQGTSPSVHGADAPRSSRTPEGYPDGCYGSSRQCDEPPQTSIGSGQEHAPSQGDVPTHVSASSGSGAPARRCTSNPPPEHGPPSTQGAPLLHGGLFAEYSGQTACTTAEQSSGQSRAARQPHPGLEDPLRSSGEGGQCEDGTGLLASEAPIVYVAGNRVIACEYIGCKEVYDFTVHGLHNYIAAGMVHHNTETIGLYELAIHLTGDYPPWWGGKRFDHPVKCWAAGDTGKTSRDILQRKMLGESGQLGTGILPGAQIERVAKQAGVADSIELVYVKHASGGLSSLAFKSYEQGRISFQGTEMDVILLDEEPPLAVYTECLLRTMTNDGILLLTFTPLEGLTAMIKEFLPDGRIQDGETANGKYVCTATWDDVPHLSEEAKAEMLRSLPPHQRDARSRGVPSLGVGAVYPVPESEIVVPDFPIPDHWLRGYGMDVGWNCTAAVWVAEDPSTGNLYLYSTYKRGQVEPPVHADAIQSRGKWIEGEIDPASRGRSQRDGYSLFEQYKELGLRLHGARNAVDSGLMEVWQRLSSGRLKIFASCQDWLTEFRLYRRDENGRIVKEDDHLMDATRYLVASGLSHLRSVPVVRVEETQYGHRDPNGWMLH